MSHTPEEIIAAEAAQAGSVEEINNVSTEEIAEVENVLSDNDANDDADAREAAIELDNQSVDDLVNQSQEVSNEGID
jgi:N utilization substance protein A